MDLTIKEYERDTNLFVGEIRGAHVEIDRDIPDESWYIRVTGLDGIYSYDGWWPDSIDKTLDEAIQEAIRGAQLDKPFPDDVYLACDLFAGDESTITCHTAKIRTAKKPHKCQSLSAARIHDIEPGKRYRHDRARIDDSFWGEYRTYLDCLDKLVTGDY